MLFYFSLVYRSLLRHSRHYTLVGDWLHFLILKCDSNFYHPLNLETASSFVRLFLDKGVKIYIYIYICEVDQINLNRFIGKSLKGENKKETLHYILKRFVCLNIKHRN